MKLCKGNIWSIYDKTDLFLFTSNSTLKANGALVMGAGIAEEVRDNFPGIDLAIGNYITANNYIGRKYGLILSPHGHKIGAFQTKIDWRHKSTLALIQYSTDMLHDIAYQYKRIDMTLPGCANGGLTLEKVLPIIQQLPDNINIWTR